MKKVALIFAGLLFFASAFPYVERDFLSKGRFAESVQSYLVSGEQWIPYPDYSNREGWDRFFGENKQAFIARGEKNLDYQWKVIPATAYLEYERSGDRNVMQGPNSANFSAFSALVMAELAEGKGRFIDQIINGVFFECERTSWALSAHLPAQYSKRTLPDHTEQIIDLASAEQGAFLSWVYYFFHPEFDKVNPIISKRLYSELYNKVILPYRNETRFWWMALGSYSGLVNNWNPWCNSNVLQCLLLLENDTAQLGRDIYKSMLSVDQFINFVRADGACEEGPSYWGHAAGKLYEYLQLLYWATGGKISLFENEMIRNMGEYISRSYVGNDWVVNFADASARFSGEPGVIYRYGKAMNSPEMTQFASYLVSRGNSSLIYGVDLFRSLESVRYDRELRATEAVHNTPEYTIYPETQFYYFKNKKRFFVAAKGGHNAESHNHNDVGTFSLYFQETPIVIDAGVGTYTRQTFGPERYSIWTMQSGYHNLPVINGTEQKNGAEYKAKEVNANPARKSVTIDISGAYPAEAQVKKWERSYRLTETELVIEDRFELNRAESANEIHFLTWQRVDTQTPGRIALQVDDKKLELLYDKNVFSVETETIPLPDTRLSNVWGKEIYLLKLKAKALEKKGRYRYVLK